MRSSAKLILAAGFVAASIIAAAQLTRRSRDALDPLPAVATQPVPGAIGRAAAEPARPAPTEEPKRLEKHYQAVAERNIFRPLISPPREPGGVEAQDESLAAPAASVPSPSDRGPSAYPGQAPDPLAGLALTGITQVGDRLRALLEHLPTRTGRYVSVGEEFHGFRVVEVRGDSVLLEKDGQQRTLSLGVKRLPSDTQQTPAPATPRNVEAVKAPTPRPAAPRERRADIREGFGDEMLSWAESMSLPELERLYSQYGSYLSPEQRAQADAYLQQRRARGR